MSAKDRTGISSGEPLLHRTVISSLILRMACVAVVVAFASIYLLYRADYNETLADFYQDAEDLAGMIEAVAQFDIQHSASTHPQGSHGATMSQLKQGLSQIKKVRTNRELVFGTYEGDNIKIMRRTKMGDIDDVTLIQPGEDRAQPIRLALQGKHGCGELIDYRGRKVLAGYAPVPSLKLAICYKMELAEVRAPFVLASLWAAGVALLAIIAGAFSFVRLSRPLRIHAEQSREALIASETRYRRAERGTNDGLWEWNVATGEAYHSPRWLEMLGYAEGELSSDFAAFVNLIHPDDQSRIQAAIRQLDQNNQPFNEELRLRRKNGEYLWVRSRADAERDAAGKPKRLTGFLTDISERKQAEMKLRTSESRLNEAQRIAQLGNWELDLNTNQLHWSAEIFHIFEIDPEKFPASYEGFLNAIHPDDREMVNAAYTNSIQTRKPYEIVHRLLMPDGRVKFVQERCETHYDAEGRPLRSLGTVQDITQHKLAEEREAAHLKKLRRLSELSVKLAGDPATVFEHVVQMIGEIFEVRVVCLSEIVGPELHFKAVYVNGQIFRDAGGCPLDITPCATVTESKDLRVFDRVRELFPKASFLRDHNAVAYCGFPSLDEAGNVVAVTCLLDDKPREFSEEDREILRVIGQRVAMELERGRNLAVRRQTESQLQQLSRAIEQTADAVMITDREGIIRYVNRAFEKKSGYTATEALGQKPNILKSNGHPPEFYERIWQTILAGQSFRGVFVNRKKDGTVYYESKTITPLHDTSGQITSFVSTGRDITEQRRAEMELRSSEERFRQVVENIREVFWMTNGDKTEMLYISPNYEKVWGRSCESLYQSPLTWLDAIHPEDRERVRTAALTKQLAGNYNEQYRIIRPDGSIRWIHDLAFPVWNTEGVAYRVAGVAEDITERKRIEEQLRQSQKMEAIGQLAGGVAHDFNNILTAMIMQSHLLLTAENLSGEMREGILEIRKAADRAAALTRQLLLFSRQQVMQARPVNLNEIVTGITKMLQRIVGEDIRLQLDLHSAPLMLQADPGMLDQVIMNLAVNARDAMPEGGRLIIETSIQNLAEAEARQIADAAPGRYVSLRVSDTGTGIPPEIIPRIFEPFFTTKEVGKGTGLGLATVFGIVKQHRGWIKVYSEAGEGATFQILFPASGTAAESDTDKTLKAKPCAGNETILLVEDDKSVRMLTRIALARQGYQILEATDGVVALRLWQENQARIGLLLTDIVMPEGINGQELAAELRKQKPGLKVIFTSGYSSQRAGQPVKLSNGDKFLQKPVLPQHLLEIVRQVLDS